MSAAAREPRPGHGLGVLALAFVLAAFMAACTGAGTAQEADSALATEHRSGGEPGQPGDGEAGTEHPVFDDQVLRSYEITLDPESLASIDADPAAEEWVAAHLAVDGTEIGSVGVRYKGSIGAFVGCLSGPDPFSPSGHKTCTKLSMKLKFDWDDPDATFHGLRRLQLHAQNHDPSQLHERLGYWLFREMGVPAPRSTHARVVVNGEYIGLFALTEEIDGRFVRSRFDDGTGNLYKEVWPLDPTRRPQADGTYLAGLRTNRDESPNAEIMASFAREFADAEPDERTAVLERWTDLEQLVAYAVVDRAIRHDDGPFHWYCLDGPCFNHNYYWYENPTDRTLHLIPWDLDNAFENLLAVEEPRRANPITLIADPLGEITGDCAPFPYGAFGVRQRSAACDPLLRSLSDLTNPYDAAHRRLVEGPLAPERVEPMIEAWRDQIAGATAEAARAHEDALSVDEWERALVELRAGLDIARTLQR